MTDAESIRIVINIASSYKWNLKQLDIKAAYLNTDLKEKVMLKFQ